MSKPSNCKSIATILQGWQIACIFNTVEQAMVTCYRLCQQLQMISKEQANLWLDIYHMNRKYEFLAGEYLVDINAGYVSVYYGGTADGVSTVPVEKMTVDGIGELERTTDVYFPEAGYPIEANMAELHVVARSMHVDTVHIELALTLEDGECLYRISPRSTPYH